MTDALNLAMEMTLCAEDKSCEHCTVIREALSRSAGPGLPVEIRLNDDKTLDEVCAPGAHLEQMGHNHWFLEIGAGKSVAVWLYSKGKITATYERRDYSESPATGEGRK